MTDYFAVTRIYADENGETHFAALNIPLKNGGEIGFLSEAQQAGKVIFRKVVEQYDYDFHHAPARQYIALLDGEIEIETSDGEKRIFRPGEVLLVEDVAGKGHKTRNLRPEVRSSMFITLD